MKLVGFVIRAIAIPFKTYFKHTLASRNQTSSVLFEIITDTDIHGYGEGAPREYVTGESINSTISTLQMIADKINKIEVRSNDNVLEKILTLHHDFKDDLDRAPSAKCAMELALLDLYGKILSQPVINIFGKKLKSDFSYSGVVSEGKGNEIENFIHLIKALRLKQVKIKSGRDYNNDLDKIKIIQSCLGDDIQLRIDANGAWGFEEATDMIERYSNLGIYIFEQPMSVDKKEKYPLLLEKFDDRIKIILDESVCSDDDARWFVENGGASGFNLKISKHGGLINTLSIHRLASENGLHNQIGCHVGETSILTAAGIIFSALSTNLFAYEGAYGQFLLEHDIVKQPLQFGLDGKYNVEDLIIQSGLGIHVDETLLNSFSLRKCICANS